MGNIARRVAVAAALTDTTGTFTVPRFTLLPADTPDVLLTSADATHAVPYLALYLQRRGTRDVTFLEEPAAWVLGGATVATIVGERATLDPAGRDEVGWVPRLFAPDQILHHTSPVTHAIQPHGGGNASRFEYFEAVYQFPGTGGEIPIWIQRL